MRIIAAVLALFISAPLVAQSSDVTIPLADYEALQLLKDGAAATVVDTMTLAGSFRQKNLTVAFEGRSVGTRAATPILTDATDVTLSECRGDALIDRSGKGAYQLIALAPSFAVRCEVRLSGSDRLRINVRPAVLAVRSAVDDGELVADDEKDDGSRVYTLVRQVVGLNQTLAATATGRYLITLLPDATRFRYAIQVHNPNRNTSPLPLKLTSNEQVQQIDSGAPYEIKDGSYVFAMPPGDSTITLTGELRGTSFAPPVAATLQYLVIESHPLLRPAIRSTPKRVSASETGIATGFRGALAFEIGANERIAWSVTRLEALRTISYAVHSATHTLFVPANGPILGESSFELDNQGAPDVILPPRPEATFASLQGEPVLMTKNAAGELTVPLSVGAQSLVVQHRQQVGHFGVVIARPDLPQLPIPATTTRVVMRYPDHWLPLWQAFATDGTPWVPEAATLFTFLLLMIWIERVLGMLRVSTRARIAAAAILAFAATNITLIFWLVVLLCGAVTLLRLVSRENAIATRVAIGVLTVLGIVVIVNIRSAMSHLGSAVMQKADRVSAPGSGGLASTATVGDAWAYQGLPARFELPESHVRSQTFTQDMLAADQPQRVTIVLLSMTFVTWLAIALSVFAAFLLWRERAAIASALYALIAATTALPTPRAAET